MAGSRGNCTHITDIDVNLVLELAHCHAPRLAQRDVFVALGVLEHLGRVRGDLA